MKYNEFVKWCNQRVCDGQWGINTAICCIEVINHINELPFWKKERVWEQNFESTILNEIVYPTNEIIEKNNPQTNKQKVEVTNI